MGALAEDEALMALDGRTDHPDYRRACRPFSDNCGFTVAEGAVYAVLMDDELAVQLGDEAGDEGDARALAVQHLNQRGQLAGGRGGRKRARAD